MNYLYIYLFCGMGIGFVAGLLGIGGGIIAIPILLTLFSWQGVTPSDAMHQAIGTSLAIVMITSLASVYSHYRKGAVLFPLFKKFTPGAILGSGFGILLSAHMQTDSLQKLFGAFLIVVALQLLFKLDFKREAHLPRTPFLFSIATLFGTLSGMLGLGGGVLMVPFFSYHGVPIRNAVATSAACLLPIALMGTLGYILMGLYSQELSTLSPQFINWNAFLCISMTSVLFAPLGVKLAHALSTQILQKVFAFFLIASAIKMFF